MHILGALTYQNEHITVLILIVQNNPLCLLT
jgi:hypothetical protein